MATPDGDLLWTDVVRVTSYLEVPARARADAAKALVRKTFGWLPGLVVNVIESFEPSPIGFAHGRTVSASDFEAYLADPDQLGERRYPLRPALTFATAREAAEALMGSIDQLTGEDLVQSIQYS
jgi:hypothetical protein